MPSSSLTPAVAGLVTRAACPVQGNADLYGLGIRIGLYIQMITVQLSGLLSDYFSVEDHIGQGTIVFVLSTVIVLVRLVNASIAGAADAAAADADPAVEAVEVFPVLTLLLVQIGVCRVSSRNRLAMLVWVAELVALTVLYNYFWWHGMDLLPRSCPDDKAFFFACVSIWGWYRSLNKAFAVFAAIGAAMAVFVYLTTTVVEAVVAVVRFLQRHNRADEGESRREDPSERPGKVQGTVDLLANVGVIVYVEVSLRWNGIMGVHSLDSPGQFMPFVIALGQFLSVFYSAVKYMLQDSASEPDQHNESDGPAECDHDEKKPRHDRADVAV